MRVAILTSAGDRAFSVGGDLYERKQMTKEEWLRQRQVFDRALYNLRQLRRPIFTAVHGMAYGGGCEMAISTDFIIASDDARSGSPRRWSACPLEAAHRSSCPGCYPRAGRCRC